ncbi:MAG: hypothetical protein NW226_17955 [Microscillaceae bacterium]|nr:hypothetical protein [Microscillaceae bacterium]
MNDELNDQVSSSFGVSVTPEISYLLSNKLALGLGIGYSYSQGKSENDQFSSENQSNGYSFSPFVQNYWMLGEKFGITLISSATISYSKSTNKVDQEQNSEFNSWGLDLGVRPGVVYFVKPKFALQATSGGVGLGASRSKQVSGSSTRTSSGYNLRLDLDVTTLSIGIKCFL